MSNKRELSVERQLVVRATDVDPFAPANHTGTVNRRMISEDTVGARKMEVLLGTIDKGQGAQVHAHPHLEQLGYVLQGSGIAEVDGITAATTVGSWSFLPQGVFHRFTVTSDEPVKILVVYAPPYGEDPSATLLPSEKWTPQQNPEYRLIGTMPVALQGKTSILPCITHDTVGACHVEVHMVTLWEGDPLIRPAESDVEQVLFVERGSLRTVIGDESICATEGDCIFIPPNNELRAYAVDNQLNRSYLLRAFG